MVNSRASKNTEILYKASGGDDVSELLYTPTQTLDLVNKYNSIEIIASGVAEGGAMAIELEINLDTSGYTTEGIQVFGGTVSGVDDTAQAAAQILSTTVNTASGVWHVHIWLYRILELDDILMIEGHAGALTRGMSTTMSAYSDATASLITAIKLRGTAFDFGDNSVITVIGHKK